MSVQHDNSPLSKSNLSIKKDISPKFLYDNHSESVFDDEKLFPIPNHSSIIKFDEKNSQLINIANIKAIICHLTSPEVIDYNFIYDFFLTYRVFVSSERVLSLLITRFIWSLQYINSTNPYHIRLGKLVLLRTFVVLRHWLLNYFNDDFANNVSLRKIFTESFNNISKSNLIEKQMVYESKIFNDLKSHWIYVTSEFYNVKQVKIHDVKDLLSYELSAYENYEANSEENFTNAAIENDPCYRRSVMLSLYDSKVHHKLPIPDSKIMQPSITKLLLQHKSSTFSITPSLSTTQINELTNSVSSKTLSSSINTFTNNTNHANSYLHPKNSSLSLKKVLNTKVLSHLSDKMNSVTASDKANYKRLSLNVEQARNFGFSISGNIKMPNSKIKEILPPTPIKKASFSKVKNPIKEPSILESDEKNDFHRKKSLRKLIDGWKVTFSKKDKRASEDSDLSLLFTNAINVISDTTIIEESSDENLDTRMDILSARIIDELEYIIRYYLYTKSTKSSSNVFTKDAEAGKDNINGIFDDQNSIGNVIIKESDIEEDYFQEASVSDVVTSNEGHEARRFSQHAMEEGEITIDAGIPYEKDDLSSNDSNENFKTPNLYPGETFEDFREESNKPTVPIKEVQNGGANQSFNNVVENNSSTDSFESLLNINDLSELNIHKIDGIINSSNSGNGKQVYRDSFQNPTQISWNNDNDIEFDDSNDSNPIISSTRDYENTQDLNFTDFSEILDTQLSETHSNEIQKIVDNPHKQLRPKLIKLKQEPIINNRVSVEGNEDDYNVNEVISSIDSDNISPKDPTQRHISFDEVNLANNRFSIRPSVTAQRNSHVSVKSYMSYDSELSLEETENYTSNSTSKGSELLKKKAGFHNLRSALPQDASIDFKFQSTSSIIEPPSEVSTSDFGNNDNTHFNSSIHSYQANNMKRLTIFSSNSIFSGTDGPLVISNDDPNISVDQLNINKLKERIASHQRKISEDSRNLSVSTSVHNSIVIPGISNAVLKELAAIPDESFDENDDPIAWALLKLEGKDANDEPIARSSQFEITNDELFNSEMENTEDILNAINNANTDDCETTEDVTTPKFQPLTPKSNKRLSSMNNRRVSVFNTDIFTSTPNITRGNNTSPQVVLDSYKISSDLLLINTIMSTHLHISFVLSYDSMSLANHFTIIEKDMLLGIDWQELIELKWNKDLTPINSWLEILVNTERNKGVELVISRFNLMVNWIISEILLTKYQTERKNVIVKFIHIGQKCFQLQNFSTLMQIILALTSEKVTKLKETWKLLTEEDILLLQNLETIVSPVQNFINLRFALSKIQPSKGCIPFVGLYLSDLTFNAERPVYIKTSVTDKKDELEDILPPNVLGEDSDSILSGINSINQDEKLINFSRFRTSAAIVKSLSQCIEWSQLFNLDPDQELLSKCLYVKSLPEEEMNYCLAELVEA